MEYFAGLFDAEGCVTCNKIGIPKLIFSNTCKKLVSAFVDQFGGRIYENSHKNKKQLYQWYCPNELIFNFSRIIPHCLVKKEQLIYVADHVFHGKKCSIEELSSFKFPKQVNKDWFQSLASIKPNESFFKWFAGFLEGDGSIRFHERSDNIGIFTTCIGAKNTFPEPIQFIYERIDGSLTFHKTVKNKIAWQWTCSEHAVEFVCKNILPFLISKKENCILLLEFLKIKKSKHRNDKYSKNQIEEIRNLIHKLKQINKI